MSVKPIQGIYRAGGLRLTAVHALVMVHFRSGLRGEMSHRDSLNCILSPPKMVDFPGLISVAVHCYKLLIRA